VNKTGAKQVTVRAGLAVDRDGREMVLEADTVLDLGNAASFPPGSTVHVTIAYDERQTDPSTSTGAPGNTRTTEEPRAAASTHGAAGQRVGGAARAVRADGRRGRAGRHQRPAGRPASGRWRQRGAWGP
jgi:hypothetical protein